MNPFEAATVLAVAATLDNRLNPPSVEDSQIRAKAWAATLDPDLPVDVARRLVTAHYRERTEAVMPAHLNKAWRAERKRLSDEQHSMSLMYEIAEASQVAVPMPAEIKAMIERIGYGKRDNADNSRRSA